MRANYARVQKEVIDALGDDNNQVPANELKNMVLRRIAQHYRGNAPPPVSRTVRDEEVDDNHHHNPRSAWAADQDDDN